MPILIKRPDKTPLGIYVHVPFCRSKCQYCDFYSLATKEDTLFDGYLDAVCDHIKEAGELAPGYKVDTVYFGGGTPSFFGADGLAVIMTAIRRNFDVDNNAEITFECNPDSVSDKLLHRLRAEGFNRVSLGIQSDDDEMLKKLGRPHTYAQAVTAYQRIRKAGFRNISIDLMYGLPGQEVLDWTATLDNVLRLLPEHISCYALKVEEGTPFGQKREQLQLPDDDRAADLYLFTCRSLEENGYRQYEISNFSRPGREGRHNLCYWHDEEYLGIGPGAHSFFEGRRFYYPRDLTAFLRGEDPVSDGEGGSLPEYVMLGLRLTEGLKQETMAARFGPDGARAFDALQEKARRYRPTGLLQPDEHRIALTPAGFLVSNELISELSLALG